MTLSLFKGVNGMTLWGKDYEIALYYSIYNCGW